MHDLILIDPLQVFLDILAFMSFIGGYMLRGLIGAILSEIIFKPLARKLHGRFEQWQETHPVRYNIISHYLENHPGNHHKCDCN